MLGHQPLVVYLCVSEYNMCVRAQVAILLGT